MCIESNDSSPVNKNVIDRDSSTSFIHISYLDNLSLSLSGTRITRPQKSPRFPLRFIPFRTAGCASYVSFHLSLIPLFDLHSCAKLSQ